MWKVVLPIWLLVAQPSVALSNDPITLYRNAIEYCAGENVANLDDGVTPANVVAKVLLGICRRKNQELYAKAVTARSDAWMVGYERSAIEEFTGYVLGHRAQKIKTRR